MGTETDVSNIVRLNHGRVLVRIENVEKSPGGIVFATISAKDPIQRGTVVAAGEQEFQSGFPITFVLSAGEQVLVDTLGAIKVKLTAAGEELLLVRAKDIVGAFYL